MFEAADFCSKEFVDENEIRFEQQLPLGKIMRLRNKTRNWKFESYLQDFMFLFQQIGHFWELKSIFRKKIFIIQWKAIQVIC